jgi:hypothetical protein
MKKIFYLLMALFAAAMLFAGCNRDKEKEPEKPDVHSVGTFTQAQLIDAFSAMYEDWQENTTIPTTLSVGGKELTAPQYQYALCKLLTNLKAGKNESIDVLSYKAADHPERDSYDKETIAVVNGPSNAIETGATEDLADIARRMLAAMTAKGQVPNQTLFQRNEAIAFSTNRAVVSMARAIAAYKADGKFPAEVKTEYLSASATLKGFAQQFITYLDVWQNTVGTVSADGSHCTDNNSAWQNVHFIPIPYSGGAYADGKDQYAPEYQPYHTIEVAGVQYDAAQCFVIAAKGFLDLVTEEGSALKQTERNTVVHTLGNGKGLNAAIPAIESWAIWGYYPWYEKSDDPCAINFSASVPCNLPFMVRSVSWFLTRAEQLTKIGNFLIYSDDPATAVVMEPYWGNISSMRTFLILARFYKHLLDNNINDKVYDAMKDVNLDYDLYGIVMPDIELQTKEITTSAEGQTVEATFVAKENWTATASDAWITVDPASGGAGAPVTLNITTAPNAGAAREGTVSIKGGNVVEPLAIKVAQEAYVAPTGATLKDFAKEFVKALDVWNANVGTVDACGIHCTGNGTAWENVHFIPIDEPAGNPYGTDGNQYDPKYTVWKLNIKDVEYTSAQAWEIAIRGLLNMTTSEGEAALATMADRNQAFTFADNAGMDAPMPSASPECKWGTYPWYEGDNSGNHLVTYNGQEIEEVGLDFIIKCGAWHVVRGLIKTPGNPNPLNAIGNFQIFGTSPTSTLVLEGYEGQICPMRELLILARIYKSLLDNNIESNVYTYLKDKKFSFDLYNQGAPAIEGNTIKAFAKEFVKALDVWNANVGTVDACGIHCTGNGTAWENVHFIPIDEPAGNPYGTDGNQYDPKYTVWKLNIKDVEYTSAQAWEIAIRGLLNMTTSEGEAALATMADRNQAFTFADNAGMDAPMPSASPECKWGTYPWYEGDNSGNHLVTYNGQEIEEVGLDFIIKCGAWHVVRGLIKTPGNPNPLNAIGNFQIFGTSPTSTLVLEGYEGQICPMRELLILARIYKSLLDNNIESNVYTYLKDKKFSFDLYNQGAPAT